MKFIKKNIKIFIAFIIVIILTSSVSIYAATKYNSSEVLYEVANSNDITVETALNDLYTKNTQTLQNLLTRIAALENNSSSGSGTTDFNSIYPVGSIYISASSTNPATLFGGTWEAYGAGRTLVGIDSSQTEFDTVGKIGGEKTHTLTISEMPSHTHTLHCRGTYGTDYDHYGVVSMGSPIFESNYKGANYTGGDAAHNNLQPYIVTYMWRRTA